MAAARNPARGENHYKAKLSNCEVKWIKDLLAQREKLLKQARDLTNAKLAEKFEVSKRTIDKISEGYSWIHI